MFSHNPYLPLTRMDEDNNYTRPDLHQEQQKKPQPIPAYQQERPAYQQKQNSFYRATPPRHYAENNNRRYQGGERDRNKGYGSHKPDAENYSHPVRYQQKIEDDHRKRQRTYDSREYAPKRYHSSDYRSEKRYKNNYHDGQPRGFFQEPKPLEQKIQQQQMQIEKLEKKVQQQDLHMQQTNKEVLQLNQQVQQLQAQRMQETVSEKLSKYMTGTEKPVASASLKSIPEARASGQAVGGDYSQAVLLKRINLYLESVHKEKISEKGYCHGIVLVWLTMMSWGVESLFYQMIKTIADYPVDQLSKIENTISLFLGLIEVGQFPGKYSNQTCTQQNVDEIIGDVQKLFGETKTYTKQDMEKELHKLAKEDNMIAVTGWWTDKNTNKEEGHTVGVYVRGQHYHFFDPNFKSGLEAEFDSDPILVNQIWERVFTNLGVVTGADAKFSLNAVKREEPPKPGPSYAPTLFGGVKMKTEAPLVPVENTVSGPMLMV